mmetsp:Transcript_40066/g.58565  ORF Transcript_40066/g.58565 Transcript_40066/m.58565 type:complete len:113 (+) Transcript_40066:663-1001(+)
MGSYQRKMYTPLRKNALPFSMAPLISILLFSTSVSGHGYLFSPRSRNLVAFQDGQWWPLTADLPKKENCPHCLNVGGTKARCGITSNRNYDSPQNGKGGPCPVNVQVCTIEL